MNEEMAAIDFPLPPKDEQTSLAQCINRFTTKIDQAIAIKEKQISGLWEYKTSLINAAVTGQIKVA